MIVERSEEKLQHLQMQARMLLEKGSLDKDESLFDEGISSYNLALDLYMTLFDFDGSMKGIWNVEWCISRARESTTWLNVILLWQTFYLNEPTGVI